MKTAPLYLYAHSSLDDWPRSDDSPVGDASATLNAVACFLQGFMFSALVDVDSPHILLVGHSGASLLHPR